MLAVILTVLKVVGWTIAAILGLVILILLIVLLSPIRYRAQGKYGKETSFSFRASYMGPVFVVKGAMGEDGFSTVIRICGFRLKKKDKEAEAEKKALRLEKKEKKQEKKLAKKQKRESSKRPKKDRSLSFSTDISEPIVQEAVQTGPEAEEEERVSIFRKIKDKLLAVKGKLSDKIRAILDKIRMTKEKIQGIMKRVERARKVFNDPKNRQVIAKLVKYLKKILKTVLPRKWDLYLGYGFDDPSLTGRITGAAAALYPVYAGHLELCPNFDEKLLEAEGSLKGHFCLMTFAVIGVKLILSAKFRRFVKLVKKI